MKGGKVPDVVALDATRTEDAAQDGRQGAYGAAELLERLGAQK